MQTYDDRADEPIPYALADPSPLPYAPLTSRELLDRRNDALMTAGLAAILAVEEGQPLHITDVIPEQATRYREFRAAINCRIGA